MNIRTENWLGHEIRFMEKSPGDWWAMAVDVANALSYSQVNNMLRKLKPAQKGLHLMNTPGGKQELSVISEAGIYKVIMRSRRKEAEDFQDWVCDILRSFRRSAGLEGFQVFRMLDKEHQRSAMVNLCKNIKNPVQVDFIKANTIANKAVSTKHGHSKMIKKNYMTPEMLIDRQPILDETVELMGLVNKFDLPIKVSETIYDRYAT
ncbi:BRO-N domain-containing protein [Paenibacillus sp. FSL R7-0026]|uniref:BRO-N domain-containing protein n=1 Tax=Paenibacillus sp. FSL R7-0026 TaxID=2921668 RepID=UPI0030F5E571